MRNLRRFVAAAVVVVLVAGEMQAATIISNIPPTYVSPVYNTNGQVNVGLGLNEAVEFTATANETVTSATVILSIQNGTTPTLGIYNVKSGAIDTQVGANFTPVGLVFGTAKTETFTGTAALTAGKNYFLVVDGNNFYNWSATFTGANPNGLIPIGAGATYVAAGQSGSYAAGNTIPSFELDSAAAAPEPSTLTLLGIGIVGLAGYGWKRRSRLIAN